MAKNNRKKILNKVIDIFKKYPDWKLLYNDGTEDDYFNGGAYPGDFMVDEPVYFLEQVFIPDAVAERLYKELVGLKGITCVKVVSQKPGYKDLHIVNSAATKEQAVAELLKLIKVDKEKTTGIGDGHNDMDLFNAVGYKVAMGNAVPELKEAADEVIGSVNKDGLVKYLSSLKIGSNSVVPLSHHKSTVRSRLKSETFEKGIFAWSATRKKL